MSSTPNPQQAYPGSTVVVIVGATDSNGDPITLTGLNASRLDSHAAVVPTVQELPAGTRSYTLTFAGLTPPVAYKDLIRCEVKSNEIADAFVVRVDVMEDDDLNAKASKLAQVPARDDDVDTFRELYDAAGTPITDAQVREKLHSTNQQP